jgi:Gpi18-like mannosyltransferase
MAVKKLPSLPRHLFWLIFAAVAIWEVGLISTSCFSPDWFVTSSWARNIQTDGLGLVYAGKPLYNYPPLMAYSLWLFAKAFGNATALQQNLYLYKLFPLAFDFAAAALAVKWAGDRRREIICLLLLIANPVYIFDSYTWGQIDSIYCALVFFTLYAMVKDRTVAAALLYTLAFNFKIQALLFAPLFGLIVLWKMNNPWPLKRLVTAGGAAILLQAAILLPFLLAGQGGRMFDILKNPVNYYHSVSMNAFNFWELFYGSKAFKLDDTVTRLGGWNAQQIGLALFFGYSLLILGPMLVQIIKSKRQKLVLAWSEESLWLMCSLIPLGFLFFCTQMHERYSQPAILFLAVYSFRTRRYWLLALMLVAYGLNMEYVFEGYLYKGYWQVIFDPRLVAAVYAILIAGLLWRYFQSLPTAGTATTTKPALAHG